MVKLEQMEIFYYVASWKSFSRAALELNVSKGYISTQITSLEKALKVKLLHRTTRYLSLTEEGNLFFESCAKIVGEKRLATSILMEHQVEPHAHLKITAPPSICNTFLAKLLPEFQKKYSKISLTLDSSSTVKNLLQHGIDIALRITTTPDENYIARVIATFRFVICATAAYLKENSTPKKPEDLMRHNCLIYSADPAQNRWPFQIKNLTKNIHVEGNLISSNSEIIKNALLKNQGIARLPEYVVNEEIANGKLNCLFIENMKIEMPIYAVYASGMIPAKINYFLTFLTTSCSTQRNHKSGRSKTDSSI